MKEDLSGQRFGRLTVLRRGVLYRRGRAKSETWDCACDCGGSNAGVHVGALKSGATKSCGCIAREALAAHHARQKAAAAARQRAAIESRRPPVDPTLGYSTPGPGVDCGVYIIRNLVDGKVYIGSSKMIGVRWKNHRHELNKGKHHNGYLQRAWTKYGEGSFAFDVLQECQPDALIEMERGWMERVRPFEDRGYNSYDAPTFGHYFRSEETRRKNSEASRRAGASRRLNLNMAWIRAMKEASPEYRAASRAMILARLKRAACQRGHEDIVAVGRDGKRMCRTCQNARRREWRKRHDVKARERAYMLTWRQSRASAAPNPTTSDSADKASAP